MLIIEVLTKQLNQGTNKNDLDYCIQRVIIRACCRDQTKDFTQRCKKPGIKFFHFPVSKTNILLRTIVPEQISRKNCEIAKCVGFYHTMDQFKDQELQRKFAQKTNLTKALSG